MKNFTDVMLDVETLGVEGKFLPFCVSVVAFNINDKNTTEKNTEHLIIRFNIESLINKGFVIQEDTLKFWTSPGNIEMFNNLLNIEPTNIKKGCTKLYNFLKSLKYKRCWATATLDYQALNNLNYTANSSKLGMIAFNKRYDMRAIRDLAISKGLVVEKLNNHNPLDDCYNQIKILKDSLNLLNLKYE